MVDNGFRKIGVDAAREDGYRLYWSVGASWGLGKLVEADFSCEFLKKYPKVDWGLHYGFGMSSWRWFCETLKKLGFGIVAAVSGGA
ncbi:hypothetical protein Droror1_Dr00020536 [Drosera rotundifolia]